MADIFKASDQRLQKDGRCLCGSVTYKLDGPLIYNVLCHCENCRHATGSAFLCATIVPKEVRPLLYLQPVPTFNHLEKTFTLLTSSNLKSYADTVTRSSQPLHRHFCSNCGSQLFALTPLNPEIVSVFAGNWWKDLDEWVPMREQFCGQRVVGGWVDLGKVGEGVVRTKMGPGSEVVEGIGNVP
jgi:hypothetical protein